MHPNGMPEKIASILIKVYEQFYLLLSILFRQIGIYLPQIAHCKWVNDYTEGKDYGTKEHVYRVTARL